MPDGDSTWRSRYPAVWIFHGDRAPFAAAVFETEEQGLEWARRWRVSGILTEYPVGDGCYDVAVREGLFRPTRPHHGTAEQVGAFSPGYTDHVHIEDGDTGR